MTTTVSDSLVSRHEEAAAKWLPPVRLIIGAVRRETGSAGVFDHINPSTGRIQAQIPMAGPKEVDEAVAAARRALPGWRALKPTARRDLLNRFAELMRENEWGPISVLENGQPIDMARLRAGASVEWTRYYAGWADKLVGDVTAANTDDGFIYTVSEPYGVVAMIITWNAPQQSLAMKLPAALAAGNTIVVKPAEFTAFTAMLWTDLARQAGIPDGVINVIPGGREAGEALVGHPDVDKISFTGGPPTARSIMQAAAANMTPLVFELGGKGANLVFADADLDQALPFSCAYALKHCGQGCALPTRMLVERSIYPDVVDRLSTIVPTLRVGDPLDSGVESGPLINEAALQRVLGIVEAAQADGSGRLLLGGNRLGGDYAGGFFMENTVFVDVDPAGSLAQAEIFGPVLSVTPFDTEAEAVAIANGTPYGLTDYIQSGDARRVRRLIPQLRAGTIGVNTGPALHPSAPFGGNGLSGFGREGGWAGVAEFIHTKTVLER